MTRGYDSYNSFDDLLDNFSTKQLERLLHWYHNDKITDKKAQTIISYLVKRMGGANEWAGITELETSEFGVRQGYNVLSVAYGNYDSNPEDLQDAIDTVDDLNAWYAIDLNGCCFWEDVWKFNKHTLHDFLGNYEYRIQDCLKAKMIDESSN